jgi:hypothetical protein
MDLKSKSIFQKILPKKFGQLGTTEQHKQGKLSQAQWNNN